MSPELAKEPGAMSDQELNDALSAAPEADNPDHSEESLPETEQVQPDQPESGSPDQPATQPTDLEKLRSEFEQLRAMNAQLLKGAEDLKRLNGHLSNEVGVLRRKAQPATPLPTDEEALANPIEAMKRVVQATKEEEATAAEQNQALQTRRVMETVLTVSQHVPDFEATIEDMVPILKAGGMPPQHIEAFRHNPAAVIQDVGHLVHLAERAKLAKRVSQLEAQLAEAKKGPQKLAGNLQAAAGAAPTISATTVKAKPTRVASQDVSKMSYKELEQYLKENAGPPAEIEE